MDTATALQSDTEKSSGSQSQSWIVLRRVVCSIVGLVAGLICGRISYLELSRGDWPAAVEAFRSSTVAYLKKEEASPHSFLLGAKWADGFPLPREPETAAEIRSIEAALGVLDYNRYSATNALELLASEFAAAKESDWKSVVDRASASFQIRRNPVQAALLWIAAGIAGGVGGWLLVVGIFYLSSVVWQFVLDRLSEVAHALKH